MRSTLPLFVFAFAASVPALAAEQINVSPFRSVELHGGGVVTIVPAPGQRVTITEGSSRYTQFRVESDGKLRIDTCNEECPRLYRMHVVVQAPSVPDVAISGGGQITVSKNFRPQAHLSAAVQGGGRIDAMNVEAGSISAAIRGGGEVLVHPGSSLAAAVNGGGLIRYSGNPAVSMAVRGGGAVRQAQ